MSDRSPSTSRMGRSIKIGGRVARSAAQYSGGILRDRRDGEDRQEERVEAIANQIATTLGGMRGAAMKFGQVLSTLDLPGLSPEANAKWKSEMSALRSQAPPVAWKQMERVLSKDLGGSLSKHFAEFDHTSIAAASIGQVYRATTHHGVEVAVKVQYPGIAEAVEADLRTLKIIFPLMKQLAPALDIRAVHRELSERIVEELDYELETQNTRLVSRHMRGHPWMIVPDIHSELCTRRVLTTSLIQGQPFEQVQLLDQGERNQYAEIVWRFYWGLLKRNLIACGDPHPGNYLRLQDGRVAFLDFGMLRKVSQSRWSGEKDAAAALRSGDGALMKRALHEQGYMDDIDQVEDEELIRYFQMAGAWMFDPTIQPLRLKGEYHQAMLQNLMSKRVLEITRTLSLPGEPLLIRRMENLLYTVLVELDAVGDWYSLHGEYFFDIPFDSQIGLDERKWLQAGRR